MPQGVTRYKAVQENDVRDSEVLARRLATGPSLRRAECRLVVRDATQHRHACDLIGSCTWTLGSQVGSGSIIGDGLPAIVEGDTWDLLLWHDLKVPRRYRYPSNEKTSLSPGQSPCASPPHGEDGQRPSQPRSWLGLSRTGRVRACCEFFLPAAGEGEPG